ncbi:cupin domain-containing protein [Myxococcus sp. K15C18031901]|uniref:cupin domain-containing protein n=1 Tax=Myxococcus dinghuensis TaxID=2906761 RepID=UPI0020A808CE|nr:cupin domain-containing protein [Myxococcus dinghuensis]MCP3100129.1 cupin domain-containing protein [Myxococcus dinghuensis]
MDVKHLSSFQDFSLEKLRKHNVFQSERFFLDVYCLAPGQAQKPHRHDTSDKVYVVLEGRCRFRVGAEEEVHGPGAAVLAPSGAEHGVANDGPDSARLLVLMTPPPEHA